MSDHSPREGRNGANHHSESREKRGYSEEDKRGRSRDRDDKRSKDPDSFTQIYVAKLNRRTRESDL